jgi:hypothetical protein
MRQNDLFETQAARSLLDQLFSDSKLYTQGKDYKELLDFVVRLRNFAPFNALLLQVQKPGLSFAASARDWRERFERRPKDGARPLLILWPFGPVALVYDLLDTDGKDLPKGATFYHAQGPIDGNRLASFGLKMSRRNIERQLVDAGDLKGGQIKVQLCPGKPKPFKRYFIQINKNHTSPAQFATLAHELGHLFLGHLGPDEQLNVPERPPLNYSQCELEAESVAYLVCDRNGVSSKSETYLSGYVTNNTTIDNLDIYQVMRAAGQVEALLGLTAHTSYDRPPRRMAG